MDLTQEYIFWKLTMNNFLFCYVSNCVRTFIYCVCYFAGVSLTFMFYSSGLAFHKCIGFLYLSEDEKTVKLSYLNYWGKRVDLELPSEDFLYFSELPKQYTDPFYKTVILYSRQDKFKLYLSGCHIIHREKFTKIFGNVS